MKMKKFWKMLKERGWFGDLVTKNDEDEDLHDDMYSDEYTGEEDYSYDEGEDYRYTLMVLSFIMWSIAYWLLNRCYPTKSKEYHNRVLILTMSVALSFVCLYDTMLQTIALNERQFDFVEWYDLIIAFTWGFFAYDLFWSLSHEEDFIYNIYHFLVLGILSRYMFKEENHESILNVIGLLSFTNPMLQLKWFLEFHKNADTFLHKFLETCFLSAYTFVRVILGTQFTFKVLNSENTSWDDRTLLLLGYIISLYFIHEMLDSTKKRHTIEISHNKRWMLLKPEILRDYRIYKLA